MTKKKDSSAQPAKEQSILPFSILRTMGTRAHWSDLNFWSSQKYQDLIPKMDNVSRETLGRKIVPDWKVAFFQLVKLRPQDVKVMILGRDPEPNFMATPNGMAYSDNSLFRTATDSPSPKTGAMLCAWAADPENRGKEMKHGNFRNWVEQGCLLWNVIPFAKQDSPGRLIGFGWEDLAQQMIAVIQYENPNCLFVIPQNIAGTVWITPLQWSNNHMHPPPIESWRNSEQMTQLINYKLFTRMNDSLEERGEQKINWEIR